MIEFKFPNRLKVVKSFQQHLLIAGLALGSSSVLLLAGCSSGISSGLTGSGGGDGATVESLQGRTHGGQFPVTGSTVQLYEVGSTSSDASGYASASTAVGSSVKTDGSGFWTYGSFTCSNSADEIYVVSSQGNPGLTAGTNNAALVLTAALGPCSQLSSLSFIYVDEVTTVATAYSLAGFSSDYLHVGTSTTNTAGLTNAFATFNNLVNLQTGQARTSTPSYATAPTAPTGSIVPADVFNSIVPNDLINTLANVLASCVNTDGTTACQSLFQYTGGSLAFPSATITNTADAAFYIAQHPGLSNVNNHASSNVSKVYALAGSQPPFAPGLTAPPNDFTMTVNFVSGGLGGINNDSVSSAQRFAIDQEGDLWIANQGSHNHSVTELNNLGAPLSGTTVVSNSSPYAITTQGGYGNTVFKTPNYVAIDLNGNAWVTDTNTGVCLGALTPSGGQLSGSPFTTVCPSGNSLQGVAVDASNNVYAEAESAITSVSQTGAVRSGFPVTGSFDVLDSYLGVDYNGNIWFIDQGVGHFGSLSSTGVLGAESGTDLPYAAGGWAAMGPPTTTVSSVVYPSIWLTQGDGTENLQPLTLGGATQLNSLPTAYIPNSLGEPTGIAVDGSGIYYFVNQGGTTNGAGNQTIANLTVISSSGTVISPANVGYTGGSDLTGLDAPNAVAIDQSGNVWVLNTNNLNNKSLSLSGDTYLGNGVNAANVTEFVGLAAPVNPVLSQDAANQTYGKKP